ncbi:2Fe-2S iron-sulfur cluster binding domain-containing protein [Acidocella sp.]|jgi:ferredoxin|uniref:2Fe-2S iron-sulfur cluster binding domain-containing protein n=1 Tax=Acidocella sp. TaxID=50710 RepID=UPI00260B96F9|nr:2Fe-2S iron-sulfur cluster binding domain-containing protein [Acidocella sp.]
MGVQAEPRTAVMVRITDTGESYKCHTDESLLTGMHRMGKRGIPVGCRGGGCSVCKVQVVAGAYSQIRAMSREYVSEEDLAHGRVLACCVAPRGEIELAVIGKLNKAVTR